jgi:hypothetical protein
MLLKRRRPEAKISNEEVWIVPWNNARPAGLIDKEIATEDCQSKGRRFWP